MINIVMLNSKEYELYKKAENEISDEHPMKCICGRLATGLHERNCSHFIKAVERRYLKLRGKKYVLSSDKN